MEQCLRCSEGGGGDESPPCSSGHRLLSLTHCEAEHLIGEDQQPLADLAREGQHQQEGQQHGRGQQEVDQEPPSCSGSRITLASYCTNTNAAELPALARYL